MWKLVLGPPMILSLAIGYALASDEERRKAMFSFIKRVPKAMGCFVDTLVGNALNDPQCNDVIKIQSKMRSGFSSSQGTFCVNMFSFLRYKLIFVIKDDV